ncbi:MAG: hypothetical protein IJB68_02960 [Ruminococcus sp.]|nr:hypothetical protein [Ruminococcus sp.]
MRKDEYRKHLDKITCTDEFRSRMEDILSTEADGEYADSVSTVERAGKINYHRWAGIAASAVLMVGIGGVMLQTMKNAPDVPGSSLSETTATTEAEIGVSTGDYKLEVSIDNYDFPTENIGTIPDEAADEIIKTLKEAAWEKTDTDIHFRNNREDIYEEYDENTPEEELGVLYVFNITCTGAEEFVYSIGFNGHSYLLYEGEEAYYFNGKETYFEIMDIVATTLFYCEPETYSDPLSQKVAQLFYSNKDIIKPNAEQSTSEYCIYTGLSAGPYHILIDKTGLINVRYEGLHNEEKVLSYDSSPEFANDVAALMGVDFESEEPTEATTQPTDMTINGKLINLLGNPDFIENGKLSYHTGGGQFSSSYNIGKVGEVGGEEFIKLLANYEWKPSEDSGYIRSDFIMIGYNYSDSDLMGVSISVNDKGELYDHSEGVLYRAENVNIAELEEAYESTAIADYYTAIAYSLSTRGDDFTTLESDISIYYDPLDETGKNKPVKCTGKMYYKNITNDATKDCYGDYYYILSDAESGYSGEMYKQGRYWAFIERGNSIAMGYYDGNSTVIEHYSDEGDLSVEYCRQVDNYTASGGYDNYNAINIDYDMLCQEALYTLMSRNDDYMNVLDEEIIVGQFSNYFKLEYNHIGENSEENKEYSEILEFRATDMGELIYFSKSRRNLETGEITPYLTFQMCDGICNSMGDYVPILNNPDFAIPQPSEELMKEFELKYGA